MNLMRNTARCALIAAVLIVMLPGLSAAQVNFSGEWRLVEGLEPSSADYRSPIGEHGSIVQDANTLILSSLRQGTRRFNIDGSETPHVTISPTGSASNTRLRFSVAPCDPFPP
jgi:hypothetical protein